MQRKRDQMNMLVCAYLAGEGLTQNEIVERLGLSQATVSRLLKEAKEEYLKEEARYRFLKEKLDEDQYKAVVQAAYSRQLGEELEKIAKSYGKSGPMLRVFPSGSKLTTPSALEERRQKFSQHAATYIQKILFRSKFCGVAWGSTLGGVFSVLRTLAVPSPRPDDPITAVPLCGELLGYLPTSYSSSSLVADLEKTLNGHNEGTLSIGMVPAFIPSRFDKMFGKSGRPKSDVVWELISLVKAYNEIFGEKNIAKKHPAVLADKLDTILTGVGTADQPLGFGKGSLLESIESINIQALEKLVCGDIAGICLAKPRLSATQQKEFDSQQTIIERHWTGLKPKQLEDCATRAFATDPEQGLPGVVIIAYGASKARCIFEAVKRGWANTLVIDDDIEEELKQLVKREISAH
jgi:DNA-binding transcriptional regulator LsrR (DeoR family)